MSLPEFAFEAMQKIPRLNRDCIITEKIDGTNACVVVSDDGLELQACSRTRNIFPGKQDNFGFALWCEQNNQELLKLGPGRHYGEWWGVGIQRGYNLFERKFSLFNADKWGDPATRPSVCSVVPVLYRGRFDTACISEAVRRLATTGSQAATGFDKPEGIVVFHQASHHLYKVTIDNDEKPKGATNVQS